MAMHEQTRKLTNLSLLAALAYLSVLLIRIPLIPGVEFLHYEPKDVIIAIGGFLYGPLAAAGVGVVVSLIEMVTISTTGLIGCVMNILATCAFACCAAAIYAKKHDLRGAIIGLILGTILMTLVMLLWNYLITPMYMGYPREAVAAMLLPVFLPFNLIKAGLNAALTMLLYKPLSTLLRGKSVSEAYKGPHKKLSLGVTLVALFVLLSLLAVVLVMRGVF